MSFLEGICGKGALNQMTKNADQYDYPYFWYGIGSKEVYFSPSAKTSFDVVVFYDESGNGVVDRSYNLNTHLSIQALSRVKEFRLRQQHRHTTFDGQRSSSYANLAEFSFTWRVRVALRSISLLGALRGLGRSYPDAVDLVATPP
ncbi:hypothetical protein BGX27_004602 [Mortierella sp. AM989]|nr:hypothetical protein BGX27_004602 [Mortierella sp. AM989]